MFTYLALIGLPEWAKLSRVQRRFVCRHFIHPMLTRWQLMIAKTCLAIPAVVAGSLLGAFSGRIGTFITLFVVTFLVTDLVDLFVVARRRPAVGRYIQSHATELQSAA